MSRDCSLDFTRDVSWRGHFRRRRDWRSIRADPGRPRWRNVQRFADPRNPRRDGRLRGLRRWWRNLRFWLRWRWCVGHGRCTFAGGHTERYKSGYSLSEPLGVKAVVASTWVMRRLQAHQNQCNIRSGRDASEGARCRRFYLYFVPCWAYSLMIGLMAWEGPKNRRSGSSSTLPPVAT